MSGSLSRIQDVIETYKSAVYEQDVARYLSTYAADIHLYDCWNDWEVVGISRWQEIVQEWFVGLKQEGVLLKTDFADVVVEENSNLAFLRSNVTFAAYNKAGEKLRQTTNRFTFGLKKENDSWIIIHQHSSLPVSIETGKGIFRLK